MANIVAFLDTNNNLSILENVENGFNWTAKLWFGMFNSLDREMFEQIKVPRVTNTGIRDVFTSVFPFSWLIYQSVEKLLLFTSENAIGTCTSYITNCCLYFFVLGFIAGHISY